MSQNNINDTTHDTTNDTNDTDNKKDVLSEEEQRILKYTSQNNETNLKFVLKLGDDKYEFYSYTVLFGRLLNCKLIQTLVETEKENMYEVEMCDHLPYISKYHHAGDFKENLIKLNETFLSSEKIEIDATGVIIYYFNYLGMPADLLWNYYTSTKAHYLWTYRIASELTTNPFKGKKKDIITRKINNIKDTESNILFFTDRTYVDKDLIKALINKYVKDCTDGWHPIT